MGEMISWLVRTLRRTSPIKHRKIVSNTHHAGPITLEVFGMVERKWLLRVGKCKILSTRERWMKGKTRRASAYNLKYFMVHGDAAAKQHSQIQAIHHIS